MSWRIEYLHPGSFFPEETYATIPTKDLQEAKRLAPDTAYCFTMWEVADNPPDLGPEWKVIPVARNKTGRFYIGVDHTALHTVEQVEKLGYGVLASNMRSNDWERVILCRTGNWQLFDVDEDEIL